MREADMWPSRPRFCRSEAPPSNFWIRFTSASSSASSSCIPKFSHWQPGYTEIFAAPSNSVPAQWIRSVMINTFFYLPAPKKSCHHPNPQAMAMQPLKLRRWKRMSQGIHPPGMRTRARSLDKIGRRSTNSSTMGFKSLKDFGYVGSSYRPRLVQHLSPF